MSNGKVVLGTLAGLAIGAIAGILFAPEKGSKTRKKIVSKGEEYSDEVKAKVSGFIDSLTEKFEEVKSNAENAVKNAASDVKKTATDVKNSVS